MENSVQSYIEGLPQSTLAIIGVCILILLVLIIVAQWKIFTKAGEKGWKSLIPIYNVYLLCKLINVSFWTWLIIVPFILGFASALINNDNVTSIVTGVYSLILDIYVSNRLAKSFGKGIGFVIGLVLLPGIFQLILGFGSSKYVENK